MIVSRRSVEEAERTMRAFLDEARLEAETRVLQLGESGFADVIAASSADSAVTFMGLRAPEADESEEAYGEYCRALGESVGSIRNLALVLAGEDVDFTGIFR